MTLSTAHLSKALSREAAAPSRLPIHWKAAGACFIALLCGFAATGARFGVDTAKYLDWGTQFWRAILEVEAPAVPPIALLYLVPSLMIGGGSLALGSSFPVFFVLLNMSMFSAAVGLFFRRWNREWSEPASNHSLLLGLALFLGMPSVPLWSYYVLSDVLFMLVVVSFWCRLSDAVLERKVAWRDASLIALLALMTRPTAIPLAASLVAAAAICASRRWRATRSVTLVLAILPALLAFGVWPGLVALHAEGQWAGDVVPPVVFRHYEEGMIVGHRVESYVEPPSEYSGYVAFTMTRFWRFFVPIRAGYSLRHRLVVLVYVPLFLWLTWRGWRMLRRNGKQRAELGSIAVLSTLYFALFHSMAAVDFDWRYQIPAMVPLWLIAGFGFQESTALSTASRSPDTSGLASDSQSGATRTPFA